MKVFAKLLLWVVDFVLLPFTMVSNWWVKVDPDKKKVIDDVEFFFLMGSLFFLLMATVMGVGSCYETSEGMSAWLRMGAWISGLGGIILFIPSYHGVRMQYLELKRKRQLEDSVA